MAAVECAFNIGNALVSMAGIVIGGLIGFFSARHISDRNARAAAVAKFRAAFAPSLARISFAGGDDANDIKAFFKTESLLHASAIEEFRPFISDCGAYEKAFNDYRETLNYFVCQGEPPNADTAWMIKIIHKYRSIPEFYSELSEKISKIMSLAS